MKKKEIQELKTKPVAELLKMVKEGRERLRAMKFDLAAGKVKNVDNLRSLKKDIARALTFIKQQTTSDKRPRAASLRGRQATNNKI